MDVALKQCPTERALIFDSDIEMMVEGSIEEMDELLSDDDYGIGEICYTNKEGRNVDAGIKYLHPYYMMINTKQYDKYHKFVHHGGPCYKTMIDIHEKGHSSKLIDFPVKDYINHDWKGTRDLNPPEFLNDWE